MSAQGDYAKGERARRNREIKELFQWGEFDADMAENALVNAGYDRNSAKEIVLEWDENMKVVDTIN